MCLITHLMKEPLIANEDIKVYKVLRKIDCFYKASYNDLYEYEKGVNKPKTEGHTNTSGVYERGWLHAYTSMSEAYRLLQHVSNGVIVEMYIPKGARYFVSDDYDDDWGDYIETDEICASALYWPDDSKGF